MAGWKGGDPEIAWFWRALRSFSQEERARFLMFVTSSSRVPLGGFTQLIGASGVQPFQIQKVSTRQQSRDSELTSSAVFERRQFTSSEHLFQLAAPAQVRVIRAVAREATVCRIRDRRIWQGLGLAQSEREE